MQGYINQIQSLSKPTFQDIRKIATKSLFRLDENTRNILWQNLNKGVDLLTTHDLMCQYLYSYGNKHEAKIHKALSSIKNLKSIINKDITIIDWGCGQGLATICYFDYLDTNYTKKVILIEPSQVALNRAKLHTNLYLKDESKIHLVQKFIDDVKKEDIQSSNPITIHFFSNILDVPQIDLKKLAKLIGEDVVGEHYFFCVSPLIEGRSHRLDAFYNYFNQVNTPPVFENLEQSQNQIQLLAEESHYKDISRQYTLKLKVFKFERNIVYYFPIDYYPSVQFHAGYKLDCINYQFKEASDKIKEYTKFELSAPFDIGASVYEDIHPIYAVLNNIITRGLPTKASPFIENIYKHFGNQVIENDLGIIQYTIKNTNLNNTQLIYSPLAVARLQKTIIEALLTEKLDINKSEWNVLVKENDVPCASLAFADIEQMFNNLTSLSIDFDSMSFPKVNLQIIGSTDFLNSPLHLANKPVAVASNFQKSQVYDLVI